MALLHRLSDSFWSYVSPRQTQKRRDKPFKAKPSPIHTAPKVQRSPSATPSSNSASHATPSTTNAASSTSQHLPLTPASSKQPPHHSDTPYSNDLEDSTFIELESVLNPTADGVFDANDTTLVVPEEDYDPAAHKIDAEAEAEAAAAQAAELRDSGFSEDAIFLFHKLKMRGFEPLMPRRWEMDFKTLPSALFTEVEADAFVKAAAEGRDFRATTALSDLILLGPRVRDAVLSSSLSPTRTGPAATIRRAIAAYTKWSHADASLDPRATIPNFALEAGALDTPSSALQARLSRKLEALAARWRAALRTCARSSGGDSDGGDDGVVRESVEPPSEAASGSEAEAEWACAPPTLYGVVVSHTVMAFVAYDVAALEEEEEGAGLRLVAMFDYGDADYDVWNSLAVAILVVHCRNRLVELAGYVGGEGGVVGGDDPDA